MMNMVCIFDAPRPNAASLIEGGTAPNAALLEIITVGSVMIARTIPATTGIDLGIPNKFKKTERPSNPKTMEGTAARLLIFISIRSVNRFFGANSSRYIAAATPIGKERINVIINV